VKRLDTPAKINGSAVYGIDVRLPGMKFATLAQSPVFGGRVKSVDDTAAKAVKGVGVEAANLKGCLRTKVGHRGPT
jgi:isoquinoline 1-oxidoreductase beta subunit